MQWGPCVLGHPGVAGPPGKLQSVRKENGPHAVMIYNDDNGHGLTYCEIPIYPWDAFYEDAIPCVRCMTKWMEEQRRLEEGYPKG